MKTYHLQTDPDDDRHFIGELVEGRIHNSTSACCWLEAKRKLGFWLTPIQNALLRKHHDDGH